MLGGGVRQFVIQLAAGSLNVKVLSGAEGLNGAPVKFVVGIVGFRVGGAVGPSVSRIGGGLCGHQAEQGMPLHFAGDRDGSGLQDGGQDVDEFDAIFNLYWRCGGARELDDEGDADGFVVEEDAVGIFAMSAEGLAVIGGDGHDGVVIKAAGFQLAHEFADYLVFIGDGSVVRLGGVFAFVGLGRIVRVVGVVEMDPEEERAAGMLAEPGEGTGDDLAAAPLDGGVTIFARALIMKRGIVGIEAAIKAGSIGRARLEDDGTDDGGGVITVGF